MQHIEEDDVRRWLKNRRRYYSSCDQFVMTFFGCCQSRKGTASELRTELAKWREIKKQNHNQLSFFERWTAASPSLSEKELERNIENEIERLRR